MAKDSKSAPATKGVVLVKLVIMAGKANPAPPVGTVLGPRGVNMMEFCKAFNDQTKSLPPDTPCPVIISITPDKKFTFVLKKPPVSYLIKNAISLVSGSKEPGRVPVSKITKEQVKKIAEFKMEDMSAASVEAAIRMVIGSARSMGVECVENN